MLITILRVCATSLLLVAPLTAQSPELHKATLDIPGRLAHHLFDFDGDGDLDVVAVVRGDDDQLMAEAWLQQDGAFRKDDAFAWPRGTTAVALGRFGDDDSVDLVAVTAEGARLASWNAEGATAFGEIVVKVPGLVRIPRENEPSFWEWPTDVDGDGHDDLIIPAHEGISVHWGRGDFTFEDPVVVTVDAETVVRGVSTGFLEFERSYPRSAFIDVNGDGLRDACQFDADGLTWRIQDDRRSFGKPSMFALPWLASRDKTNVLEETRVNLTDLDEDTRADLVLTRMRLDGLKMQTTMLVLMNRGGDTPFLRKPDTAIVVDGNISLGPVFRDGDGDGDKDLVYGSFGAKMSDQISRFMGKVPVELHVHEGTGKTEAPFSTRPVHSLKSTVSTNDFGRWGMRNTLSLAEDFDGDGTLDLFRLERKKGRRVAGVRRGSWGEGGLTFGKDTLLEHKLGGDDVAGITYRKLADNGPLALVVARRSGVDFVWIE